MVSEQLRRKDDGHVLSYVVGSEASAIREPFGEEVLIAG